MLRGVIIGQYYAAESPIHRLDPRTKIGSTFVFIVVLFVAKSFLSFAILAGFGLFAVYLSTVPLRMILRGLRPILFILTFTLVLHVFMTKGDVWFRLGPFTATWEGLWQGAFVATRLVILIGTTSLLTLSTSPISLTDGLERLLKPFARVGVPAHELAMMMTIALRFIPTLLEEAEKVMKAQMARGADFETGNMLQRARSLVPLLVPLFVGAFRRADELAMAMEARCYRGGENRTRMRQLRAGPADYVAVAATSLVAAFVVFLRFV
ncbi:MAG: energy-coupling factor transporter transmembrane component T [Bacillota bacterium]